MNGDENRVKSDFLPFQIQRKIIPIHLYHFPIGCGICPVISLQMNKIGFVKIFVEHLIDVVGSFERNLVFARVSARHQSNSFHDIRIINDCKITTKNEAKVTLSRHL